MGPGDVRGLFLGTRRPRPRRARWPGLPRFAYAWPPRGGGARRFSAGASRVRAGVRRSAAGASASSWTSLRATNAPRAGGWQSTGSSAGS